MLHVRTIGGQKISSGCRNLHIHFFVCVQNRKYTHFILNATFRQINMFQLYISLLFYSFLKSEIKFTKIRAEEVERIICGHKPTSSIMQICQDPHQILFSTPQISFAICPLTRKLDDIYTKFCPPCAPTGLEYSQLVFFLRKQYSQLVIVYSGVSGCRKKSSVAYIR